MMNKPSPADVDLVLRDQSGKPFPLLAVTMIGREAECQIVLDDSKVSRYHAKLTLKSPSSVLVEDLHSTNGTFINGVRVHAPRAMAVGDELRLHKVSLRLTTADSGSADATVLIDTPPLTPVASAPIAQPIASPAFDADSTFLLNSNDLAHLQQIAHRAVHVQRPGTSLQGPCLLVLSAPIRGKVFALRANGAVGKWTIGRSGDADLELIDRTVSREHARIVKHGTLWQIVNINAANKIYVNGIEVETADLQSGDRIRLGRTEIEFRIDYNAADAIPELSRQPFAKKQIVAAGALTFLLVLALLLVGIFKR